jgi:hypothetical protein|tara:strand:- start:191 stop:337 length:147 start_codon:yes stop_codon:yes gene_type:complete
MVYRDKAMMAATQRGQQGVTLEEEEAVLVLMVELRQLQLQMVATAVLG